MGLRDDRDLQALSFDEPRDDGVTEGGVIDIGVAGDDNDVEFAGCEAFVLEIVCRYGNPSLGIEEFGHGG